MSIITGEILRVRHVENGARQNNDDPPYCNFLLDANDNIIYPQSGFNRNCDRVVRGYYNTVINPEEIDIPDEDLDESGEETEEEGDVALFLRHLC